jgi:hypothetical protein
MGTPVVMKGRKNERKKAAWASFLFTSFISNAPEADDLLWR